MTIRPYKKEDKQSCIQIFESNCPKFFDPNEQELFNIWLDHQVTNTPTYKNAEKDCYYVIETIENGIIGCGGFYLVKDEHKAQLAWGMIHNNFHKQGFGTALYKYRQSQIEEIKPGTIISLGTSQHTFSFFEKMGFKVSKITEHGYGEHIHKYDME